MSYGRTEASRKERSAGHVLDNPDSNLPPDGDMGMCEALQVTARLSGAGRLAAFLFLERSATRRGVIHAKICIIHALKSGPGGMCEEYKNFYNYVAKTIQLWYNIIAGQLRDL